MGIERNYSIRDARAEEAEVVRELTLAAYQEYAEMMPIQYWEAYHKNIEDTLDNRGEAQTIVAEQADIIIGSVLLYPPASNVYGNDVESHENTRETVPEMRLLSVLPAKRGLGIGFALTQECARRAQETGAHSLGLHTIDMMQAAIQLYERMGFERTPETDFYPTKDIAIKGYSLPLQPEK